MPARLIAAALALVAGAVAGFVLTFVHREFVADVAGVPVPWGLIGSLAIVAALVAGFRLAFDDRMMALGSALGVQGMIVLLGVLPLLGAGSPIVRGDLLGYIWAIGAAVLSAIVIVWPPRATSAVDRA